MLIEREDFICEELDLASTAETRPWRFACVFYFHFLSSSSAASCKYKQYEKHSLYTGWDSEHYCTSSTCVWGCLSDTHVSLHIQAARAHLTSSTDFDIMRGELHLVSVSSVKFYRNKSLFLFCKSCDWTDYKSEVIGILIHVTCAVNSSFMRYSIIRHKAFITEPQPLSC